MNLSDAIRIGASWSKQIKMYLKTSEGTCALGAAYEGTFGEISKSSDFSEREYIFRLANIYPIIRDFYKFRVLGALIAQLNDYDDWTREEIADLVEAVELELGYHTSQLEGAEVVETVKEGV